MLSALGGSYKTAPANNTMPISAFMARLFGSLPLDLLLRHRTERMKTDLRTASQFAAHFVQITGVLMKTRNRRPAGGPIPPPGAPPARAPCRPDRAETRSAPACPSS